MSATVHKTCKTRISVTLSGRVSFSMLPQSDSLTRAAVVGVSLSACFALYQYCAAKSRSHVKSFRPFHPVSLPPDKKADITRDRITKKKIPPDIDVIVIGSGIGSLYMSALLAKAGRKVVVLEQHYVAGGCTHCFEDKGWEFDTGVHYVGRIDKYRHLLNEVSDGEKIQWQRLGTEEDGFCYDSIKVGPAAPHPLRSGEKNFVADLAVKFPEEEEALWKYVALVKECNKKADVHFFGKLFPKWVEWLLECTVGRRFQALASRTAQDVLDELFSSSALKALLLGQYGDYGMFPSEASFFIHAGIVAHYLEGAYYPVGGPQVISRALIPTITRAGGKVFVNAPVQSFQIENKVCTGVVLKNGLTISAPVVVSGAGAFATQQILDRNIASEPTLPPIISPKHTNLLGGVSHVYAFLGFEGDSEELKLPSSNLWVIPSEDIEGYSKSYLADPFSVEQESKEVLLFAGFPSAKDPSLRQKYPNKTTCVVITEAKAEWFAEFEGTETNKRPKEYGALMKKFEKRLVDGILTYFPQLKGRLRYCEVASPLTNSYYLGRAASYGLTHQPSRYTAEGGLRPETDIPGLWLTGQDVATNGFAGALNGGLLTAHALLGYTLFDLLVCDTNIVTDMAKAK